MFMSLQGIFFTSSKL
uniref:Uncharacterized protein n=1 Tax=Arundo donax TaxID=35708 RepID=A0A0A9BPS5_ARUDO